MLAGALAVFLTVVHPDAPPGLAEAAAAARQELRRAHAGEEARIDRGVGQVAGAWQARDGDAAAFRAFVGAEFLPRGAALEATFARLEHAFERLESGAGGGGYLACLRRELRRGQDLEIGPILPIDRRLAAWDVGAHVSDDLFATKIAFVLLLNFPATSLEERLREGGAWTPRQWAEARLAQHAGARVPAEVAAGITQAYSRADEYVAGYNIHMHHLVTPRGERLFPPGLRLISHWNLRDDLKARYAEKDGLARQRMIQLVMERIVRQEIPKAVIDDPRLDWEPQANTVKASTVKEADAAARPAASATAEREPDERYRRWLDVFQAERRADAYDPGRPTFVARRLEGEREIPEKEVRALLEAVLVSPLGADVARRIESRLGRPLEPFDIWYAGFKPRATYTEPELDAITKKRYPDAAAFAADLPRLFTELGFTPERARYLAERIEVDPSRGAGHAFGSHRRDDKAHLRTRVGADGMDYKGYNIAVHELGHNVEQTFSLQLVPHTLMHGVPNTAFTEALAFVFQARDLELLGLSKPDAEQDRLRVLDSFWSTREIAGVALVDIDAWRWLYEHPEASPAEFRAAVVQIAHDVWNRHYAPIFGVRDSPLLAIYSHLITEGLYMPNYPIGRLIELQLEEHFRNAKGPLGAEFERVSRQGALTPDAWMRGAVGGPLSAEPLLAATKRALAETR